MFKSVGKTFGLFFGFGLSFLFGSFVLDVQAQRVVGKIDRSDVVNFCNNQGIGFASSDYYGVNCHVDETGELGFKTGRTITKWFDKSRVCDSKFGNKVFQSGGFSIGEDGQTCTNTKLPSQEQEQKIRYWFEKNRALHRSRQRGGGSW